MGECSGVAAVMAELEQTLGKPYEKELDQLPATYEWAMGERIDRLSNAIGSASSCPLMAVGSGGSFTSADFAASLHREVAGAFASAHTPMEAVTTGLNVRPMAVLVTTAGGKHPDVLDSFRVLARREPQHLIAFCLSTGSPLARLAAKFPFVDLVELAAPFGSDGFLATNSLLASVVLLTRAYSASCGIEVAIPADPGFLVGRAEQKHRQLESGFARIWERETVVVLHGPATRTAAIDLESKLTEAALNSAQLADYRHFAHGRHHWLAKHAETTAVVALVTPEDELIASKTLALLPPPHPSFTGEYPVRQAAGKHRGARAGSLHRGLCWASAGDRSGKTRCS